MLLTFFRKPCYLPFLLVLPLLATSCAHKRAYKRAMGFEEEGRYVEAAEQDLNALDRKPDYEDAKNHLRKVAPQAYQELLTKAEGLQASSRWIEAVETYRYMETLLGRFQGHDVVLETIDAAGRISWARQQGRNHYYSNAEQYFQAGDYLQAIDQYNKVTTIAGYYQNTRDKLWQSYVALGNEKLENQEYQAAIDSYYRRALEYATDVEATNILIAEAYYRWAENLASEEDYRGAYEMYSRTLDTMSGYKDAEQRRGAVFEEALVRVAVLPFRNSTSYGAQYSGLLTDQLLNKCINSRLQYVIFLSRSHLDRIIQEYELTVAGAVDPSTAAEIGRLEGINFFITGTVSQISEQTTSPTFAEKTHQKTVTVRDSTGKEIKKTETIYYREYTCRRTVQIGASYQIVDAETGRYIHGEDFSERIVDEARWVRYQGSINDLPENKRGLLDAPTEPRSADMLINDGIRLIAEKMSQKIIRYYR